MKSPGFVCPADRALLKRFSGRAVAVRTTALALAADAAAAVAESGNHLACVIVDLASPLSAADIPAAPAAAPVAVMAPAFGAFRELASRIDALRRWNARVYLPCDDANNVVGLRILASLGVHACAQLTRRPLDWEALTDLMTYAILGRSPHATIEPFDFIAEKYDPHGPLAWGAIEFDDPRAFLHLNEQGQVALSADDLRRGAFIAQDPGEVDQPAATAAVRACANAWRRFFIDDHPCAACPAWKPCMGRFGDELPEDRGCAAFFTELIDVVGVRRSSSPPPPEEPRPWRP